MGARGIFGPVEPDRRSAAKPDDRRLAEPEDHRPVKPSGCGAEEPGGQGTAEPDDRGTDELSSIRAGWPEDAGEGCRQLDATAVLRANRRSFALRVRGQSMINADICDGDIVVGEFTPEARPGAIVVALVDGESTLKRLVVQHGRPYLVSENPAYPDLVPLAELVIQGVVHTIVRRAR